MTHRDTRATVVDNQIRPGVLVRPDVNPGTRSRIFAALTSLQERGKLPCDHDNPRFAHVYEAEADPRKYACMLCGWKASVSEHAFLPQNRSDARGILLAFLVGSDGDLDFETIRVADEDNPDVYTYHLNDVFGPAAQLERITDKGQVQPVLRFYASTRLLTNDAAYAALVLRACELTYTAPWVRWRVRCASKPLARWTEELASVYDETSQGAKLSRGSRFVAIDDRHAVMSVSFYDRTTNTIRTVMVWKIVDANVRFRFAELVSADIKKVTYDLMRAWEWHRLSRTEDLDEEAAVGIIGRVVDGSISL